jgi:hypothetical protein
MDEGTCGLQTLCAKVEQQMKTKKLKQTAVIAQLTSMILAVCFVFPAQILSILFHCLELSLGEIQQRRRVL